MSAISRETVNPIPATVAAPTRGGQASVRGKRRLASHVAPMMPIALPPTRPKTIPIAMGDEAARESASPLISTPALQESF